MSLPLRDYRGRITVETDLALEAEVRAHGMDKCEIVREILHAWALRKVHAATFLSSSLKRNGFVVDDAGTSGNVSAAEQSEQ